MKNWKNNWNNNRQQNGGEFNEINIKRSSFDDEPAVENENNVETPNVEPDVVKTSFLNSKNGKIAIGVVATAVVAGGAYLIWKKIKNKKAEKKAESDKDFEPVEK